MLHHFEFNLKITRGVFDCDVQVEGYSLLLTAPFVAYSGYAFTWAWFTRLDDFFNGLPGMVAPGSALHHVELRQRQLIAVLGRGAGGTTGSQHDSDGQAGTSGTTTSLARRDTGNAVDTSRLSLDVIDSMYENAMSGPLSGPILRLFLADYIR